MNKTQEISRLVDKYEKEIITVNDTIWEYAEAGMKEYKSAAFYVDFFKGQGFKVSDGVSGIPTAFVAEWGEGAPVIGFLGEYDALPTLSQKAAKAEKDPVIPGGYGQGCGHNSLGAGAAGAALAFRDYLKDNGLKGTVRYYGCPGEEYGSGKVFMARDGLFSDLAACFTWHPSDINAVWGTSSLANISVFFSFKGVTAHAAANPYLGRSAVDAVELMNVGVNYLREHVIPEARMHYAYVDAGGIAPNVVHDHATVHYFIRAPKIEQAREVYARVIDVAEGAAKMTGTTMEYHIHEALCDYLPNRTLSTVMQKAFEEIGAPLFDAEDNALAEQFRKTYSKADLADIGKGLADHGMDPSLIGEDDRLHTGILPFVMLNKAMPGSTDVGDASYCAPTAQINVATYALGTPGHSWQITGQSCSGIAHKGTVVSAKVMALAAAMVHDDAQTLSKAKEELDKATGGKYICPLPDDVKPTL